MMRIGLLSEGRIDEELLPPLLKQLIDPLPIMRQRKHVFFEFPAPANGFGEIPKNLKMLLKLRNDELEWGRIGCDLFVIVHDSRRTESVQREIRNILQSANGFPAVYGLAVQEIEAWVLGDIENVNRHIFKINPCPRLPCAPEDDPDPKRTLNNVFITQSDSIEFDRWNAECARQVAPCLRADQVKSRCQRGFGKLARDLRSVRLSG
jgi:hypothetical protein